MPRSSQFPHRANEDGTIDSICPRCFITVATSSWEADLERMEEAHVCESARLRYYEAQIKKETKRPPGKQRSQEVEPIKRVG